MSGKSIAGALGAAVLGALAWALITATTGYEVGYVAWGIGLLIGFGAAGLGGRGAGIGILCAALALVSIFAGKVLAVKFTIKNELRELVEPLASTAIYEDQKHDAEDFAAVQSEAEYPNFMIDHNYTEAGEPGAVPPEEVADFTRHTVPTLRWLAADKPDYAAWRPKQEELMLARLSNEIQITELVAKNLGGMDLLFALLGLVTAYRIPNQGEEGERQKLVKKTRPVLRRPGTAAPPEGTPGTESGETPPTADSESDGAGPAKA